MDLVKTAIELFQEAVKAADPYAGIMRVMHLEHDTLKIDDSSYSLEKFRKIIVVGAGKASARMGEAVENVLADRIEGGWINVKYEHSVPLKRITVHECGHPVPDENGLYGSDKIEDLLRSADENTLIIGVISGGGSALMPSPADGISLDDKKIVTGLLLKAGADITEMNTIRKHLSVLKGGGMSRLAYPAALHLLVLSDVVGDPLDTIASGPGYPDKGTFGDCIDICEKYGIFESLPLAVQKRFNEGARGMIPETPKSGEIYFRNTRHTLVGNNRLSVNAAASKARGMRFNTVILTSVLEGEAREAGNFFAAVAKEIVSASNPALPPACIIAGGETTVTIKGNGKGGRNQEMALSAALGIKDIEDTVFLSGGTDGTDGPTDAAGGIVDGMTVERGEGEKLDASKFLADNDSYNYLKRCGGLVMTGPTGTNVMDIQIMLVGKPDE